MDSRTLFASLASAAAACGVTYYVLNRTSGDASTATAGTRAEDGIRELQALQEELYESRAEVEKLEALKLRLEVGAFYPDQGALHREARCTEPSIPHHRMHAPPPTPCRRPWRPWPRRRVP